MNQREMIEGTNAALENGHAVSWINILLGIWMIISPFALGFANVPRSMWNNVVLGVAILLVAAVRSGDMTIEEACRVYQLSEEEFLSWQRAFEIHGLGGLRTTRIQQYRAPRSARAPYASPKQPVEPHLLRQATPSEVS